MLLPIVTLVSVSTLVMMIIASGGRAVSGGQVRKAGVEYGRVEMVTAKVSSCDAASTVLRQASGRRLHSAPPGPRWIRKEMAGYDYLPCRATLPYHSAIYCYATVELNVMHETGVSFDRC